MCDTTNFPEISALEQIKINPAARANMYFTSFPSLAWVKDGSRDSNKNNYSIRRCWLAPKSKSDKTPNKCRGPIALTETSCFEGHQMIRETTVLSTSTPLRNASSSSPNDSRSQAHRGPWWYLGRTNVVWTYSCCLVLATVAGKIVPPPRRIHRRLHCILRQLSISNLLIALRDRIDRNCSALQRCCRGK